MLWHSFVRKALIISYRIKLKNMKISKIKKYLRTRTAQKVRKKWKNPKAGYRRKRYYLK